MQLFCSDPDDPENKLSEENSKTVELKNVLNDIYIDLENVGSTMRFDFGNMPGTYTVKNFEIREAPVAN